MANPYGRPRVGTMNADGIRPKRLAREGEEGRWCIVSREGAIRLYKAAERAAETEMECYNLQCLRERLEDSYDDPVELYLVIPDKFMKVGGQAGIPRKRKGL